MKPNVKEQFHKRLASLSQKWGIKYATELRFHPVRKWRWDGAFPDIKIACEVDGGVWTAGRHTRGAGFIGDQIKCNEGTLLGWAVYRFQTADVGKSDEDSRMFVVLDTAIERALGGADSASIETENEN